ncbi:phospholipid scramblase 1-like [Ptychodera flava]|uniref:phospholipid scramblase 1-like n=1 Tax=Ptychodera flava TaxID=63121 RepID=UPI00396A6710
MGDVEKTQGGFKAPGQVYGADYGQPPTGGAVVVQPGYDGSVQPGQYGGSIPMTTMPQGVPMNCPPGLEYLTQIDQILVYQKRQFSEMLCGCERKNEYRLCNSMGQQIYHAQEDTGFWNRQCCGRMRPFAMHLRDNSEREVLTIKRPYRCEGCCCFCCLMEIQVYTADGVLLGGVNQTWSLIFPRFDIRNAEDETILKMDGPCCHCRCCSDINFDVKSLDKSTTVGRVTKQWAGMVTEAFTDADNFGITFPMDLDVKMKAVMIGAMFLIDFMFFERD